MEITIATAVKQNKIIESVIDKSIIALKKTFANKKHAEKACFYFIVFA